MKLFNLRSLLFSLFTITTSSFTLWLFILFTFNPYESSVFVLVSFYITMLVYLGGIFTFFLYLFRLNFSNNELVFEILTPSFRQGYILSFIFVISLVLKGLSILNYFEFLIILALGVIAELYFKSKNERKLSPHH